MREFSETFVTKLTKGTCKTAHVHETLIRVYPNAVLDKSGDVGRGDTSSLDLLEMAYP